MSLKMEKKIKEWKKAEVEELKKLMESYRVLAISSLHKVRTAQIQELRKRFREEIKFRCSKNNLVRLALKEASEKKPGIEKLEKYLDGSNILIFTNLTPFKLSILFSKNKVKLPAKAGDVAPTNIVVPESNTGIPPGPIISEFSEVGLPTKIEGGSIWITRDTVVVRKGETISGKLASILSRLGIKPMEAGLTLKAAYEDGLVHPPETLQIDLDATFQELKDAVVFAYNLAVNASYPTPQTIPVLLQKALVEARSLAFNAGVFEKEFLPFLLAKGYMEMVALKEKVAEKDSSLAS
ncbi:50S ribosomal protein L10 [Candidatus Bathyarchaeota archaeon]|nr:MAG: 50S ribosomal protein L10 [Candidatus Bathyarchaeota archaeon]